MTDCKLCVHNPVCDLWRIQECQDAALYSGTEDGCDLFMEKRRWIPVTERLPEDSDESVLAIVFGKPCENITLEGAYQIAVYLENEGWIIDEFPEWETPQVTHWMPLPEPPKEGYQ